MSAHEQRYFCELMNEYGISAEELDMQEAPKFPEVIPFGFNEEQAARLICGETIDSAMQI